MLEAELLKHHLDHSKLTEAAEKFNVNTLDDLYAAIGSGNARLQQVINSLLQLHDRTEPEEEIDPQSLVASQPSQKSNKFNGDSVIVSGVGNLLTHMAKCCQPVPGDDILGFITQGRGISVHRTDCEQLSNVLRQNPEREVEVQWGSHSQKAYQATLQVTSSDRQGLLRDVSTIISNERVLIVGIASHADKLKSTIRMSLTIEISNSEMLNRILSKLRQLDDVIDVKRLSH